jgi:hypothetical protein
MAALRAQGLSADTTRLRAAVSTSDGVPRVVEDGGRFRWPKLL